MTVLRCHQQGVAIITALLLTTLAITIVASLFWQQQVQVRSIENQRLQMQKQWILRGSLDWASLILREDARHSSIDTLDEPWAVPLAETRLDRYVETGRTDEEAASVILSGSIIDAQGLFNLSNLSVNGIIRPAEVACFERLLISQNMDEKFAQITAQLMANAQQKTPALPPATGQQSTPQPMNLTQVEDLLVIPGVTPDMVRTLKILAIFLPQATPLNINTAPAAVLAAKIAGLTPSDAATLVRDRSTAAFRDPADFRARLAGKHLNVVEGEVSTASNYFLINGKVRMDRAGLQMRALVERVAGRTRLIWIREE